MEDQITEIIDWIEENFRKHHIILDDFYFLDKQEVYDFINDHYNDDSSELGFIYELVGKIIIQFSIFDRKKYILVDFYISDENIKFDESVSFEFKYDTSNTEKIGIAKQLFRNILPDFIKTVDNYVLKLPLTTIQELNKEIIDCDSDKRWMPIISKSDKSDVSYHISFLIPNFQILFLKYVIQEENYIWKSKYYVSLTFSRSCARLLVHNITSRRYVLNKFLDDSEVKRFLKLLRELKKYIRMFNIANSPEIFYFLRDKLLKNIK